MAKPLARLSGTMIAPGVSRNGRAYSQPLLARAYDRLAERIRRSAEPDSGVDPVAIYTSHAAAGDDASEKIIGLVDEVSLEADGSIRYGAALADTSLGRDVLALVDTTGGGRPFVRGVSIRGAWMGDVTPCELDGVAAEAGPDLEILGLDLTATPGVPMARIDDVTRTPAGRAPRETGTRHLIFESAPEANVVTETVEAATWAAPGNYHADGKPRLPLDTLAQATETFRALGTAEVAATYTENQLKRCRERAKRALEGWGVDVHPDGQFYVSLNCGAFSVSVSATCLDPAELDRLARAAATAASDALHAVKDTPDPDLFAEPAMAGEGGKPAFLTNDDDEDDEEEGEDEGKASSGKKPPFAKKASDSDDDEEEDDDATKESAPSSSTPEAPAGAATPQEDNVADNATPAVEAANPVTMEQLQALLAQIQPAAPVEPAAPAVEAAPAEPTAEERIAALEAALAEARQVTAPAAAPAPAPAVEAAAPALDMAAILAAVQEAAKTAAVAAVQADAKANGVERVGLTANPGNAATETATVAAQAGVPALPRNGEDLHLCTEAERKQMAAYTEMVFMGPRSVVHRGY